MLPQLKIASPCPASWEKMTGNNQVRHCSQCNLNVYNFSAMTSHEIETLINASDGQRLCGRLYQRADGTLLTRIVRSACEPEFAAQPAEWAQR
jgi:hypothetical protein